jgi:alpha-glucosidase
MMRTSRDAQIEYAPEKRPWLLSRSGGIGLQRYAQTWTGDNRTNWNSLQYNIPMGLNLAMSGVPFNGHDVGGFAGPLPEAELLLRWIHNGIFHPRFCIHSWNDGGGATEPWTIPEIIPQVVYAMRLRNELIPYLYTLCHESVTTGAPVHRPLIFHYQNDARLRNVSFDFLLGRQVFIPGVYKERIASAEVLLPGDSDWFDFHSGTAYKPGKATIAVPLEQPTFLVLSGELLPLANLEDSFNLKVHIFPPSRDKVINVNESFTSSQNIYLDDGETLEYKKSGGSAFLQLKVTFTRATVGFEIAAESKVSGDYDCLYKTITWIYRNSGGMSHTSNLFGKIEFRVNI